MKKEILIIDDEPSIRDVVGRLLKKRSYNVSAAENGAEAMALLDKNNFDLVILDLELGGNERGLDLLTAIKANHSDLPVVIFTGLGYEDEAWQEAKARGADGFLSKALPMDQLIMDVNRLLRHRPGEAQITLT